MHLLGGHCEKFRQLLTRCGMQLSDVVSILYGPFIVIVKLSILVQYITLFAPHRQGTFHRAVHVLIWSNILFYTIITFAYIFEVRYVKPVLAYRGRRATADIQQCTPIQKMWLPNIPGHCIGDNHQRMLATGIINIISDFSILILPFPIIWQLHLPMNKKIGVTAIFALGLLACISSILRFVYSMKLVNAPRGTTIYLLDVDAIGLWRYGITLSALQTSEPNFYSFAEIATGIIVGCLPVLPRFFQHLFPKTLSVSSGLRTSWRRIFRRSSDEGTSTRQTGHTLRSLFRFQKIASTAPQVSLHGLSGSSLHMAEQDLPASHSPRSTETISASLTVRNSDDELDRRWEKASDMERIEQDEGRMGIGLIGNDLQTPARICEPTMPWGYDSPRAL